LGIYFYTRLGIKFQTLLAKELGIFWNFKLRSKIIRLGKGWIGIGAGIRADFKIPQGLDWGKKGLDYCGQIYSKDWQDYYQQLDWEESINQHIV